MSDFDIGCHIGCQDGIQAGFGGSGIIDGVIGIDGVIRDIRMIVGVVLIIIGYSG